MKRIIVGFFSAVLLAGIIPLYGCSEVEENYLPENCGVTAEEEFGAYETFSVENQRPAAADNSIKNESSKPEAVQTADVIPELKTDSEINGSTHTFTVDNVYSQGKYYTVSVVGEKRGDTFGNFSVVLSKDGSEPSRLEIDVPEGERFIIIDSVAEGISYGCEIISNMRDFAAKNYPDIIQLDFYKENELEIPQYGRYFAVFDGELTELEVYENGIKAEPRGTHTEPRSEGEWCSTCAYIRPRASRLWWRSMSIFSTLKTVGLTSGKWSFWGGRSIIKNFIGDAALGILDFVVVLFILISMLSHALHRVRCLSTCPVPLSRKVSSCTGTATL